MWVISPSLTYTSCPQPTAQYGQIDCTTLSASSIRGFSVAERGDCTAGPRPSASPCRSWRRTGQDAINEPSATVFFSRDFERINKSHYDMFAGETPGNPPFESERGVTHEHHRRTAGARLRGGRSTR